MKLLNTRPALEKAAYLIVGWVGVKLAIVTLSHPQVSILPEGLAETVAWKVTFWVVLLAIAIGGWFLSGNKKESLMEAIGK